MFDLGNWVAAGVAAGLVLLMRCAKTAPETAAVPVDAAPPSPPEPAEEQVNLAVQQQVIETQQRQSDDLANEVAEIRWQLIEDRYIRLNTEAERRHWEERPPEEDSPAWDRYQEWLYIRENTKELKAAPEANLTKKKVVKKRAIRKSVDMKVGGLRDRGGEAAAEVRAKKARAYKPVWKK